jgi:hypothetical protein
MAAWVMPWQPFNCFVVVAEIFDDWPHPSALDGKLDESNISYHNTPDPRRGNMASLLASAVRVGGRRICYFSFCYLFFCFRSLSPTASLKKKTTLAA